MKAQLFSLMIFVFSPFALAQEDAPVEVIEVKGTKDGTSYYDSLGSIVILDEGDLSATGRANNLQVLNAVPNVTVNKNGESFSVRGINNVGVTGYQKDNLASIIIDDLFQTDLAIQAGSFNLWDMERIEVLRGAQSTHQGVNSLAGSILLEHRKASEHFNEGAAKVGVGNFWNREIGVVANPVVSTGRLATRISYDREMNDGYVENIGTGNDKWGDWERDRLTLGVNYKISAADSIYIDAKAHRQNQGGVYVQGNNPYEFQVDEDVDYNLKTRNHQLSLNYYHSFSERLGNTFIVGFSKSGQSSLSDADGTSRDTAGVRRENRDDHYLSFENRLLYKNAEVTNLFGLHSHDFELNEVYDFNLLFPLTATTSTPVSVFQSVDRTRKAYAVFNSTTYDLDEKSSVVLGLRGEYVESTYGTGVAGRRLQNLGGGNAAVDAYIAGISGNYSGKNSNFVALPKIGYLFKTGLHHAGISWSRAYRTAGVSINRRRAQAVEYGPEFTNNFELSYKHAGRKTQFGTNFFYVDWSDQQVQVQLSGDFYDTQVQNAAKSEVYGAEMEGRTEWTGQHATTAGVGYTFTRFREFETRTLNYDGKEFPFAAPWTMRITHDYQPHHSLHFLFILRYASSAYANAENTRRADEQFYFDWVGKYEWVSNFNVETYVNNIFDGRYRIFDGTPTSATSPYQASYHQVSTPREFGLRLNYTW